MLPVAPKAMASGNSGTEFTREASPRFKIGGDQKRQFGVALATG